MEDTQKLTHLAFMEAEEAQLLEDFFSGRNWDSQKQIRWNKMQAEVFHVEPGRVYAQAVVELHSRGVDWEDARFAVGQARIQLEVLQGQPAGFAESMSGALAVLKAREAA